MKRVILNIFLILALTLALTVTAFAQDEPDRFAGRELSDSVAELKLDTPVELSGVSGPALDSSLFNKIAFVSSSSTTRILFGLAISLNSLVHKLN